MVATDGAGHAAQLPRQRRELQRAEVAHTKNLLVPVVGNFAGPKALRAVGAWLKAHNGDGLGVLPVERRAVPEHGRHLDGLLRATRRALPIDETSQFIRSYRGGDRGFGGGGGSLDPGIFPMVEDLKGCQ